MQKSKVSKNNSDYISSKNKKSHRFNLNTKTLTIAIPILLFCFSMAINVIILVHYLHSPFAQVPQWDAENYWKWAQQIASGNILGNAIFYQSPLYPYFLALLIKIFGIHLFPVYLMQCLLSACSTVFVYYIANKTTTRVSVGIIAACLFALFDMQSFYTMKILSECLAIFLLLLTTALLVSGNKLKILFFAGLAFGLAIIAKPHLLIAAPIIPVFLFFTVGKCNMIFVKKVTCFIVPLILMVSIVTIRNYAVGKDIVFVSSNGGENFYIGNHKGADGTYCVVEGMTRDIEYQNEDVSSLAEKQTGSKMKRSEISRYFMHKGLEFIIHNPKEYVKLEIQKIKFIFSGAERSTMYYRSFEANKLTSALHIAFVNFYFIFPLFFLGLIASFKRAKEHIPLYLFLFINTTNILLFFYDTRFMLLNVPFVSILAAWGIMEIVNTFRVNRSFKVFRNPGIIVFLICSYASIMIYTVDKKYKSPDGHMYMTLGDIYLKQNRLTEALDSYMKSSALDKSSWMPVFGASATYFLLGKRNVAAQLYTDGFANLSTDFKTLILRDKNLDPVREYINSQKQSVKTLSP